MFQSLGVAVSDLAAVIALLLPGFLAISVFEAVNPRLGRHRLALQWVMWSLAVSLLLFGALHGIYRLADWPRRAIDPEFYSVLIIVAIAGGYMMGRVAGSRRGTDFAHWLKILLPPWVWVEVLGSRPPHYIVVHLTDGTTLMGSPRRFTDDPRETIKEVYLENPMILSSGRFQPFPQTEGILVDSTRINFMQVLE